MRVLSLHLILLALAAAVSAAHAKPQKPKGQKDWREYLPYENIYTTEEIRAQLYRMSFVPLGDSKLAFQVLVPKTWQEVPLSVKREQLARDAEMPVPLAGVAPRGRGDVLLEVRYLRVPPAVPLERVMTVYAEKSGFSVLARQRGEYNGRVVEDALLIMNTPALGPVLTRLTLSRRDDLIFMLAGSARMDEFPRYKKVFAAAALSFDPSGEKK